VIIVQLGEEPCYTMRVQLGMSVVAWVDGCVRSEVRSRFQADGTQRLRSSNAFEDTHTAKTRCT